MTTQESTTTEIPALEPAYSQLCSSYQAIDGFRQKLLGILPLASGAGIFLFTGMTNKSVPPAYGVFGFLVTLGLLIFEIHGIRKCTHFIVLGRYLEEKHHIHGQFRHLCAGLQPLSKDMYGFAKYINEPLAAGVIYPAVLGGWTFLALHAYSLAWLAGLIVFGVGFYYMLEFNKWLVDKDAGQKLSELNQPES